MITPGDVRAIGRRQDELPGRNERHELERAPLHRVAAFFELAAIGRVEPGFAQLLELRIGRPAEPRLVAGAADREVDRRIHHVGTDEPGVEDVPAAFLRRLPHRAARDQRAPVARLASSALRPSFFSISSVSSDCECTIGWSVASMMTMFSPL